MSDSTEMRSYDAGRWILVANPAAGRGDEDQDAARRKAGYELVYEIQHGQGKGKVVIDAWGRKVSRPGATNYLVDVSLWGGGETVGAETFADLMDLLSRWAPAFRVADSAAQ